MQGNVLFDRRVPEASGQQACGPSRRRRPHGPALSWPREGLPPVRLRRGPAFRDAHGGGPAGDRSTTGRVPGQGRDRRRDRGRSARSAHDPDGRRDARLRHPRDGARQPAARRSDEPRHHAHARGDGAGARGRVWRARDGARGPGKRRRGRRRRRPLYGDGGGGAARRSRAPGIHWRPARRGDRNHGCPRAGWSTSRGGWPSAARSAN